MSGAPGAAVWHCASASHSRTVLQNSNTETFYNADGSLQTLKVQAVARTYAKAIAGQPSSISMSFDTDTAEFNLQYASTGDRPRM